MMFAASAGSNVRAMSRRMMLREVVSVSMSLMMQVTVALELLGMATIVVMTLRRSSDAAKRSLNLRSVVNPSFLGRLSTSMAWMLPQRYFGSGP